MKPPGTSFGGGNWSVDSFFDITYRIDFVGAPGGTFQGMSGSTNSGTTFVVSSAAPEPATGFLVGVGALVGFVTSRRRRAG